jgi:uncharacterized membrane protein YkoI
MGPSRYWSATRRSPAHSSSGSIAHMNRLTKTSRASHGAATGNRALTPSQQGVLFMSKFVFATVVAGTLFALPQVAAAKAPPPKISKASAQAKALKLAPGKIISSEYEYEGKGWRWSFDIQQKGHVQEIGIDGRTGRVVENKSEGKKDRD